jgi:hypothetical protein
VDALGILRSRVRDPCAGRQSTQADAETVSFWTMEERSVRKVLYETRHHASRAYAPNYPPQQVLFFVFPILFFVFVFECNLYLIFYLNCLIFVSSLNFTLNSGK